MKICKIKNCKNKYYARRYCHTHYEHHRIFGKALPTTKKNKGKICKLKTCFFPAKIKSYCSTHYALFCSHKKRGLPLNSFKKYTLRGKKNPRWNGGTSEYPNHYLMKKNRLIILKNHPHCEICGKKAMQIHHLDKNKTNHSLNNLQALCRCCHQKTFSKIHQSKFRKLYGITLLEMAKQFGKSPSYYYGNQDKIPLKQL